MTAFTYDMRYMKAENLEVVKKLLPEPVHFNATITSYKPSEKNTHEFEFQLLSREIVSPEICKKFIQDFGVRNESVYVMRRSSKSNCSYRTTYKCQHSAYSSSNKKKSLPNYISRKKHTKKTNCNSNISIVTKMMNENSPLTKITIKFLHNHDLYSAEALRYRKPVRSVFVENKKGPANALKSCEQFYSLNDEAVDIYQVLTPVHINENEIHITSEQAILQEIENSSSETVVLQDIELLSKNFSALVERIQTDPSYYCNGIRALNKNLGAIINNSSPAAVLNSLLSFNKACGFTPKRKMRSIKRIGVNAAGCTGRIRLIKSAHDHNYAD